MAKSWTSVGWLWFRRRRWYLAIALLIIAIALPIAYYFALYYPGYVSVAKTVTFSDLTKSFRSRGVNNSSITFHIYGGFQAFGQIMDVGVSSPAFSLVVDTVSFGTVTGADATIHPKHCLVFPISFQTTNETLARTLSDKQSNSYDLTITASVSSGIYQKVISTSRSWEIYDTVAIIDPLAACHEDYMPELSNSL